MSWTTSSVCGRSIHTATLPASSWMSFSSPFMELSFPYMFDWQELLFNLLYCPGAFVDQWRRLPSIFLLSSFIIFLAGSQFDWPQRSVYFSDYVCYFFTLFLCVLFFIVHYPSWPGTHYEAQGGQWSLVRLQGVRSVQAMGYLSRRAAVREWNHPKGEKCVVMSKTEGQSLLSPLLREIGL